MDLSLALAQGFHNAPRLYGDSTVRTAPRIKGLKSGSRAACSAFVFGIYDGVTGLVLQPVQGAKEAGVKGAVKGVGKGVGGFVLKDLAAILEPPAYLLKGGYKQLMKGRRGEEGFVRRQRVMEGEMHLKALTMQEAKDASVRVAQAWRVVEMVRVEDEKEKGKGVRGRWKVLREKRRREKVGFEMGRVGSEVRARGEERKHA